MLLQCPRCTSRRLAPPHPAIKTPALVRAAGRAARIASTVLTGTKPVLGITLSVVSDAILASIDEHAVSAHLSEHIHRRATDYRCLDCKHRFNL